MSGLDDLATQRERATKRTMPPPKTPARSTPVQLPKTTAAPTEPPPPAATTTPAAPEPGKTARQQQVEELARYSIYLDATLDDYLTDVLNAGRKRRPKLAVSCSAVVRLALTELASRMDPARPQRRSPRGPQWPTAPVADGFRAFRAIQLTGLR